MDMFKGTHDIVSFPEYTPDEPVFRLIYIPKLQFTGILTSLLAFPLQRKDQLRLTDMWVGFVFIKLGVKYEGSHWNWPILFLLPSESVWDRIFFCIFLVPSIKCSEGQLRTYLVTISRILEVGGCFDNYKSKENIDYSSKHLLLETLGTP